MPCCFLAGLRLGKEFSRLSMAVPVSVVASLTKLSFESLQHIDNRCLGKLSNEGQGDLRKILTSPPPHQGHHF